MTKSGLIECPLEECFYPDTNCSAGHTRVQACPHVSESANDVASEAEGAEDRDELPVAAGKCGLNRFEN